MATFEREDVTRDEEMETLLAPYRAAVEDSLREVQGLQVGFSRFAFDFLEGGGKRLRPAVALLICEALSGSYLDAVPVAVVFELAHAASLIQDDIIDDSPTRHSRPTAHTKHGLTTAILLSDMIIFETFEALAEYRKIRITKGRLASLLAFVARSAKEAAEGEHMEMQLSAGENATVEDYVRLAGLKTGALFAGAAASGALAGRGKARVVSEMYEFGRDVGVSFQMVDDILDMTGTTSEMGKPMLKDLQNNAANIVLVHALQHADPARKSRLRGIMKKNSYGYADLDELLGLFDDLGSVEYASRLGRTHAEKARARLRVLPESEARSSLEKLTLWLGSRRH